MAQLEIDAKNKEGQPGDLADSGVTDKISEAIANPTPVAQVSTVTVGAATNTTLYETLVNSIVSQFTSDGSATITEIAAGLVLAMQNNGFLDALVTVVDNDPDITITAVVPGTALTVAVTDAGSGDLGAPAATVDNVLPGNDIPFGKVVVRASAFKKVKLPDAAGQAVRGISLKSHAIPNPKIPAIGTTQSSGEPVYIPTDPCNILRRGRIVVEFEGAEPTTSDGVFFRHTITDAVTQTLGAVTVVDDGNTDAVPNAEWNSLLPEANLAVIDINNP